MFFSLGSWFYSMFEFEIVLRDDYRPVCGEDWGLIFAIEVFC
jgi:hypothetical protein